MMTRLPRVRYNRRSTHRHPLTSNRDWKFQSKSWNSLRLAQQTWRNCSTETDIERFHCSRGDRAISRWRHPTARSPSGGARKSCFSVKPKSRSSPYNFISITTAKLIRRSRSAITPLSHDSHCFTPSQFLADGWSHLRRTRWNSLRFSRTGSNGIRIIENFLQESIPCQFDRRWIPIDSLSFDAFE